MKLSGITPKTEQEEAIYYSIIELMMYNRGYDNDHAYQRTDLQSIYDDNDGDYTYSKEEYLGFCTKYNLALTSIPTSLNQEL